MHCFRNLNLCIFGSIWLDGNATNFERTFYNCRQALNPRPVTLTEPYLFSLVLVSCLLLWASIIIEGPVGLLEGFLPGDVSLLEMRCS